VDLEPEVILARQQHLDYSGFVMIDAGGCSYETKARNIQKMGAHAMIIIEDREMSELDGSIGEFVS